VSDPGADKALAQAVVAGCAAALGPLLGMELEVGPVEPLGSSALGPGPLAQQPVVLARDRRERGELQLLSPLQPLAGVARRMLAEEDARAKAELAPGDLDAIAEILGLWAGAVQQALTARGGADWQAQAGRWRQVEEASPPPGSSGWRGWIALPGQEPVPLGLWLPGGLLEGGSTQAGDPAGRRVLLVGIEEGRAAPLVGALEAAQREVQQIPGDDPELAAACRAADVLLLSASDARALSLARGIRTARDTWTRPVVLCADSPTRSLVVRALHAGVSHVLVLPAEPAELLRVIAAAGRRATRGRPAC
jgi:hypothetical protein